MFPSGQWEGFWVQESYGRQPMTPFFLNFEGDEISGSGTDIIGKFIFAGEYDEKSGQVLLVKQYIGKHRVIYIGQPDGEGSIQGTWKIGEYCKGPFLIRPSFSKSRGDEPIQDMG